MYYDHVYKPSPSGQCAADRIRRKGFNEWVEPCKAERNSVLHDPRHPEDGTPSHWCAALEAGGDCCHED